MKKQQAYMQGADNKELVKGLNGILADTFVLYYKTHTFHWNVVGEHFRSLHLMFEEQYNELWQSTDILAERVRQLDGGVPINLTELKKYATLQETGQTPDAVAMVAELANDNAEIVNVIYPVLHKAEEAGDQGTVDMLTLRVEAHEKAAWMLRSSLKN
jgi:starvation-inducible DNA-binding protein